MLSRQGSYEEEIQSSGVIEHVPGSPTTWRLMPVCFLITLQALVLKVSLPTIAASVWFPHADGSPDYERAQRITGTVESVQAMLALISVSYLAKFADQYGRKPIMCALLLAMVLPAFILLCFGDSSGTPYYIALLLQGCVGTASNSYSFGAVTSAYIADIYPAAERTKQFGVLGAASAVGMIVNPLVGTFLTDLPSSALFGCCVGLMSIAFLYVTLAVPESLQYGTGQISRDTKSAFTVFRENQVLRYAALVSLLGTLPEAGVVSISLSYCDQVLGFGDDRARAKLFNMWLFAVIGLTVLVSNLVFLPYILSLGWSPTRLLAFSQFFNVFHLIVYGSLQLYPYPVIMYLNAIPVAFALLSNITVSALVSASAGPDEQGSALGALQAIQGVAAVLGPWLFSQLFEVFGRDFHAPSAPFFMGALLASSSIFVTLGPLRKVVRARLQASEPLLQ